MNPVWCPTPGFQDILELPSIADLNLNIRINYAGDSIPGQLKVSNEDTFFKTTFNKVFKEAGLEGQEIKTGIIRFYKRFQYECQQSILLLYSCKLEVNMKILDGGTRGPPQEFYQPMHEDGSRLTKTASGFSLKTQTTAVIYHLSFAGMVIILGMFYFSTIICKQLLEYLFVSDKRILAQKDADLDFSKHLKSD